MAEETFKVNFAPQQSATAAVVPETVPAPSHDFHDELFNQIAQHEGKKNYSYLDSNKHPTIGIGFNLDDKDNRKILSGMGYNVQDVIKGKLRLDDNVVKQLYVTSLDKATNDAAKWIPNLDEQPESVQKAIIDMSFNLGATKLSKFVKTREALINKDYAEASKQMLDSDWAKQVGKRAKNLSALVLSAAS